MAAWKAAMWGVAKCACKAAWVVQRSVMRMAPGLASSTLNV